MEFCGEVRKRYGGDTTTRPRMASQEVLVLNVKLTAKLRPEIFAAVGLVSQEEEQKLLSGAALRPGASCPSLVFDNLF